MYTEEMLESIKKVEASRTSRIGKELRRMDADEKDNLLKEFHPDYKESGFATLKMGPNKGEKAPAELADLLQANSRVLGKDIDLTHPDYDVDVLVIGGGGAGASAAIEAHNGGANVMIVTKLRIGDANTMMAEGGIQQQTKRTTLRRDIIWMRSAADISLQSRSCYPNWLWKHRKPFSG